MATDSEELVNVRVKQAREAIRAGWFDNRTALENEIYVQLVAMNARLELLLRRK